MINLIKKLFNRHENENSNNVYTVYLNEIKIKESFAKHYPKQGKMYEKLKFYTDNGIFKEKIVLNRNFELIDGYTSYLIAKMEGIDQVEAIFMD